MELFTVDCKVAGRGHCGAESFEGLLRALRKVVPRSFEAVDRGGVEAGEDGH